MVEDYDLVTVLQTESSKKWNITVKNRKNSGSLPREMKANN